MERSHRAQSIDWQDTDSYIGIDWVFQRTLGLLFRRLAIRAAKFGPEADFLLRAVGGDPTPVESLRQRKKRGIFEGALREQ
jgi:hypothetical protein